MTYTVEVWRQPGSPHELRSTILVAKRTWVLDNDSSRDCIMVVQSLYGIPCHPEHGPTIYNIDGGSTEDTNLKQEVRKWLLYAVQQQRSSQTPQNVGTLLTKASLEKHQPTIKRCQGYLSSLTTACQRESLN